MRHLIRSLFTPRHNGQINFPQTFEHIFRVFEIHNIAQPFLREHNLSEVFYHFSSTVGTNRRHNRRDIRGASCARVLEYCDLFLKRPVIKIFFIIYKSRPGSSRRGA